MTSIPKFETRFRRFEKGSFFNINEMVKKQIEIMRYTADHLEKEPLNRKALRLNADVLELELAELMKLGR